MALTVPAAEEEEEAGVVEAGVREEEAGVVEAGEREEEAGVREAGVVEADCKGEVSDMDSTVILYPALVIYTHNSFIRTIV